MIKRTFVIIFIILVFIFIFFIAKKYLSENTVLQPIMVSNKSCSPQIKKCLIEIDNSILEVSLDNNIYYLKPFHIYINPQVQNKLNINDIYINFKMKNMDMGINRFKLRAENNSWKGQLLLPICITGRADWIADLDVVTEKAKYRLSFPVIVKKSN